MRATNLTLAPVELAPENGPGLLGGAVDGATDHVRELVKTTARERALAEAGTIKLDGEPTEDRYDAMTRGELEAEAADREGLEVPRDDGREDLPPREDDYRRALRVHDAEEGA